MPDGVPVGTVRCARNLRWPPPLQGDVLGGVFTTGRTELRFHIAEPRHFRPGFEANQVVVEGFPLLHGPNFPRLQAPLARPENAQPPLVFRRPPHQNHVLLGSSYGRAVGVRFFDRSAHCPHSLRRTGTSRKSFSRHWPSSQAPPRAPSLRAPCRRTSPDTIVPSAPSR